ncbi:flagellar biosynthesis protein FliZ [Mesobacillus zeae]|uniref:Flagellar biosynthesis protein FliZ n=2 Tax=Mesobacillus zeae TaxID=1917180 RepID=A0A398BFW7_9BACI|nr:flagellar biosynthesis protein FliZ [Mesobacillus zeae]
MTGAEQLNSVKDCLDNKAGCGEVKEKEAKQDKDGKPEAKVGVTIWDFIRMILATAFVVGLLYLLLKYINKRSMTYKRSQLVENLGGTSLGTNRSIQVVKAGNRLLVVGVGENIQLLKEIDDPEEFRQIIEEHNNKLEQLIQPSDIVTKLLKRTNSTENSGKQEGTHFSAMLKMQLEEAAKGRKKLYEEIGKKGKEGNE